MSTRIIVGLADGIRSCAVLYDSVTETAFGPMFDTYAEADSFCRWCYGIHIDPRQLTDAEMNAELSLWRGRRPPISAAKDKDDEA